MPEYFFIGQSGAEKVTDDFVVPLAVHAVLHFFGSFDSVSPAVFFQTTRCKGFESTTTPSMSKSKSADFGRIAHAMGFRQTGGWFRQTGVGFRQTGVGFTQTGVKPRQISGRTSDDGSARTSGSS